MSSLQRPTVLLLIPHLGGGGSERLIETLARSLDPERYDVHLALITSAEIESRQFPPTVSVHKIGARRVRTGVFGLLRLIWRVRPSLILSGISHLNLLVLALRPFLPRMTRIIVRQNGELAATLAPHPRLFARRAYMLGYCRADHVICQTEAMAREIHRGLAVEPSKLLVLPNPTAIHHIRTSIRLNPGQASSVVTLLSIGRLVPEKGFDILLDAFASSSFPYRSAKLIIVGSGPEQRRLQQQADALKIADRVHFAGHVPDPVIRFRHASLFVLSSRTEGLPNAMLEAAAAGLPIVATPSSPGVLDLLHDREGVWLADEVSSDALCVALKTALTSFQPGRRYPHAWVERYDLSRAIPAYEAAMDRVIAGSAH